jgi:hypothetical protein
MNVRAVRSPEGALELLGLLGYDRGLARPYDLSDLGWQGRGTRLLRDRSPTRGYGVVVAQTPEPPRSLRTFGRRLVENFHDQPLAFVGVGEPGRPWREWVVVRPRLVRGGGGAVAIAKLQVDPSAPTAHDVEVLSGLSWHAGVGDTANQEAINQALDVERVTRRFFIELNSHFERIATAVEARGARRPGVRAGIDRAGGSRRVALRIVTQTLFCYFLQRKRLLEGDRRWLSNAYRRAMREGGFYARVMEPLFYEALNTPVEQRVEEWRRDGLPFLNGGLFERQYGDVSFDLDDALFSVEEGLLGFLDGWSFTVAEDTADETEVAVDPEMLGKVFENLIADDERKAQGTIYTPRPVVQFMCREALVPYLQRTAGIEEAAARTLLVSDDPFARIGEEAGSEEAVRVANAVQHSLPDIRVLDPAVGSGAFLLGMLAEVLRLRRLAHAVTQGSEPSDHELHAWKLHAIEHGLFGVDINPTAIELCRLRLWLSLLVEAPPGRSPDPLPNLEYRTICADSLTDFVAGREVQDTRDGVRSLGFDRIDPGALTALRDEYFAASDPAEKARLRDALAAAEDDIVEEVFERALATAREVAARARVKQTKKALDAARAGALDVETLRAQFRSRDRMYPVFLPGFHAPDVVARGGWDVVIMNPPYVGRKDVPGRIGAMRVADLERHYGRTYDLMLHFGFRALQLVCAGGALSMIFNDSIFTSADADDFRRALLGEGDRSVTLHAAARTKCFEGVAVNGGAIVATRGLGPDPEVRWVENYGRPPVDLLGATRVASGSESVVAVGQSELFETDAGHLRQLPHRPLFRPSAPAIRVLEAFRRCAGWREFGRYAAATGAASWTLLSNTRALEKWKAGAHRAGWYDRLRPGQDFVLLGLVTEGGQGLATADDRRFIAAIDGTPEADEARMRQLRLEELTLGHADAGNVYRRLRTDGAPAEVALLEVTDRFNPRRDLGWPKGGEIRVALPTEVRRTRLSPEEVRAGIANGPTWVPFEKGDDSGPAGAARWRRDNPLVIDWSPPAVRLLRERAAGTNSYRKPRLQNEQLWGSGGIAWNAIARYLRVRLVPEGGIFGHGTPVIRPTVDWLSLNGLLALLNAPVLDFILRTFLSSLMNVHVGDLRRLPVPMLTSDQAATLDDLGSRAVEAKEALDARRPGESLEEIERQVNHVVRELYGVGHDAELWVMR